MADVYIFADGIKPKFEDPVRGERAPLSAHVHISFKYISVPKRLIHNARGFLHALPKKLAGRYAFATSTHALRSSASSEAHTRTGVASDATLKSTCFSSEGRKRQPDSVCVASRARMRVCTCSLALNGSGVASRQGALQGGAASFSSALWHTANHINPARS